MPLLEAVRTRPPDLILPALDGDVREMIREVKSALSTLVPIIVVAPAEDFSAAVAALDAGADEFILRTAGNAELLIRVRAMPRLKRTYDAMAELNATPEQQDGRVCLQVADTGGGIPPEALEHIFEPFFTTKGGQGTGLGLAICNSIVRDHGGEIRVESRPGQGSTFTILLPIAEPP